MQVAAVPPGTPHPWQVELEARAAADGMSKGEAQVWAYLMWEKLPSKPFGCGFVRPPNYPGTWSKERNAILQRASGV